MNDAFNQYMKLAFKGVVKSKEFSHYANLAKRSKYGNKKTVLGNVVYDSQKEANRAFELGLLLKAGEIKNLERQKDLRLFLKQKQKEQFFTLLIFVIWKSKLTN